MYIRIAKYSIGDIVTNGHYHFLIEGIRYLDTSAYKYEWRNLEDNEINEGYVHIMDETDTVWKVA